MATRAELIRLMKLSKEFQRDAALQFSVLKRKGDKPGFVEIVSYLNDQPNYGQVKFAEAMADIYEQMAINLEAENELAQM